MDSTHKNRGLTYLWLICPLLVKQFLKFFQCTPSIVNGTQYLIANVDIKCYDFDHYLIMFLFGAPAFIFYVAGIPLITFFNLYIRRHRLHKQKTRLAYGFLYADYEPEQYMWEFFVITRLGEFFSYQLP